MLIRCPECAFTRQVDGKKIPDVAEFATCPKCKKRFRFRVLEPRFQETDAAPAPDEPRKDAAVRRDEPGPEEKADAQKQTGDVWSAVEKLNNSWEKDEGGKKAPDGEPASREEISDGDWVAWAENPDRPAAEAQKRSARKQPGRPAVNPDARPSFLANAGSVPWEYRGGFMMPQGFLRTLILSFTRVQDFFGGITPRGSLAPALIFALIMHGLQVTLQLVFMSVPVPGPDGQTTEMSISQVISAGAHIGPVQMAVLALFSIVLVQFLISFLLNVMVGLVNSGQANFRLTFKVTAYSLSPLIFSLIPAVGPLIAVIGNLILLVIGLRQAYKLTWPKAALIVGILMLLLIFLQMRMLHLVGF